MAFSACEDPKEENKNLLAAVKFTFADLPEENHNYFLQVWLLVNFPVSDDKKVFLRFWKPDHHKDKGGKGINMTHLAGSLYRN